MLRFAILLSGITTIITFIVSICNYLLTYIVGKEGIAEAIFNNIYVKYWVTLTVIFLGITICLLLLLLFVRPKETRDDQLVVPNTMNNYYSGFNQTFTSSYSNGTKQIEEYVTVRIKKSELSKLG